MKERLARLRLMEEHAVTVCEATAGKVSDADVAATLRDFARDHRRHADELDNASGEPVVDQDFRRLLDEQLRHAEEATDEAEALRGLLLAEREHLAEYGAALGERLPEASAGIVRGYHEEEARHVAYLERVPVLTGAASGPSVAGGTFESWGDDRVGSCD